MTSRAAFSPDKPRSLVMEPKTWIWGNSGESADHSGRERTEMNGCGSGLRRVGNTDWANSSSEIKWIPY